MPSLCPLNCCKITIARVANEIKNGHVPVLDCDIRSQLSFFETERPEDAEKVILEICKRNQRHLIAGQLQILTPMKKEVAGTYDLNLKLQDLLNPLKKSAETQDNAEFKFRVNDKVMQTKNNQKKNIFNGDIGIVRYVKPYDGSITVSFDGNDVTCEGDELEKLILAYAITIHKSQGSEYPVVLIPLVNHHLIMLNRNLLYTAITRGKTKAILIGQREALQKAVETASEDRISNLSTKLKCRMNQNF